MDFLPFPLASMLAGAFITLLCFVLLLNIFGLPANWVLLGLVALWKVVHPGTASMDMWFWIMMVGIALVGEALEMGMQILKAKRYGSSSSGTFAGMVGAIAGAILLAPLFFGLGALIGALAGAWTGCFAVERLKGRPLREALDAAFGAMMGRFLGTVCKCGAGGAMLALAAGRIWPKMPSGLPPVLSPDASTQVLLNLLRGLC
ncbi:DUF456 domain-containing protein [Desulfovibrio desulfuricans]|uniref:DUF456 domain-containing protein n=1 Tax=Desulfovibrio desulfuricans TaxID=876 RepID=A0A4P7UHS7_DESDE|nr:DUF456 domain-containing protein [Desulfovibrio desulfuricans]QCC85866.1 DUF456 domain-containing protein [Desulfovibrio desulfuricans]